MPRRDPYLDDTLVHEAGHQWWYGMVATNEFEDAWMDEGINQYANARVMAEEFPDGREVRRFFGGFVPWVLDDVRWDRVMAGEYRTDYSGSPTVDIPSTPSFRYWPRTSDRSTIQSRRSGCTRSNGRSAGRPCSRFSLQGIRN